MGYQATFKRYEIKYMLNAQEKKEILRAMEPHMKLDQVWKDDDPQYLL